MNKTNQKNKHMKIFYLFLLSIWIVSFLSTLQAQNVSQDPLCLINDQLVAKPFLINMDSVEILRVKTDTLISFNNKIYNNCFFMSYSKSLTLIPLKETHKDIQDKYEEMSHVYIIDNEVVEKDVSSFLIDKNYIWKTDLSILEVSEENQIKDRILLIKIFTLSEKKKMESKFNIR